MDLVRGGGVGVEGGGWVGGVLGGGGGLWCCVGGVVGFFVVWVVGGGWGGVGVLVGWVLVLLFFCLGVVCGGLGLWGGLHKSSTCGKS